MFSCSFSFPWYKSTSSKDIFSFSKTCFPTGNEDQIAPNLNSQSCSFEQSEIHSISLSWQVGRHAPTTSNSFTEVYKIVIDTEAKRTLKEVISVAMYTEKHTTL